MTVRILGSGTRLIHGPSNDPSRKKCAHGSGGFQLGYA